MGCLYDYPRVCVLYMTFYTHYRQEVSIFLSEGKYIPVRRMFKLRKYFILWLFFSINEIAVVLGNCSTDCTSCTNDTCVTCELGTYLESGTCHLCPEHCTSCYNSAACNNCSVGYFGLLCAYNCPLFCISNMCNKDSGTCTSGCIDGYFLSGSSCFQCQPNCKTCATSSNNCVECREGNYGASCQYPCSRCKDGICTKENCTYGCGDGYYQAIGACNLCSSHCRSCSDTFDNCHTCEDGYFGQGCQFPCSDCIPCNQEDGSCPGTMNPPTTYTKPTTSLIESVTSVPRTTTQPQTSVSPQTNTSPKPSSVSRTTTQPQTSVSPQTNTSPEPSKIFTSAESIHYQQNQSVDNTIIIYGAGGGGGGLAFLVLIIIVVVICKRRGSARSHEMVAENIDMTENENYISANDIDDIFRKPTDAPSKETHVVYEENDVLYSLPNKTNRPTVVPMETRST